MIDNKTTMLLEIKKADALGSTFFTDNNNFFDSSIMPDRLSLGVFKMWKRRILGCAVTLGFVCIASGRADVKLPAIFADHMVLQQKSSVVFWGWADPNEKIKISGSWQQSSITTRANLDGNWTLNMKTPEAGGPHTLTIRGSNQIDLKDILFGEVWLCAGQSNMKTKPRRFRSEQGYGQRHRNR